MYPPERIMMIKALRDMTRVLGKLGLKSCYHDNQGYIDFYKQNSPVPKTWINLPDRYRYGWGLKEAKDAVENYLDRLNAKARSTTT